MSFYWRKNAHHVVQNLPLTNQSEAISTIWYLAILGHWLDKSRLANLYMKLGTLKFRRTLLYSCWVFRQLGLEYYLIINKLLLQRGSLRNGFYQNRKFSGSWSIFISLKSRVGRICVSNVGDCNFSYKTRSKLLWRNLLIFDRRCVQVELKESTESFEKVLACWVAYLIP